MVGETQRDILGWSITSCHTKYCAFFPAAVYADKSEIRDLMTIRQLTYCKPLLQSVESLGHCGHLALLVERPGMIAQAWHFLLGQGVP